MADDVVADVVRVRELNKNTRSALIANVCRHLPLAFKNQHFVLRHARNIKLFKIFVNGVNVSVRACYVDYTSREFDLRIPTSIDDIVDFIRGFIPSQMDLSLFIGLQRVFNGSICNYIFSSSTFKIGSYLTISGCNGYWTITHSHQQFVVPHNDLVKLLHRIASSNNSGTDKRNLFLTEIKQFGNNFGGSRMVQIEGIENV